MNIDSKHPEYLEYLDDWNLMRDSYRGEQAIKKRGVTYLPATSGMEMDGMVPGQHGWKAYHAYRMRSVYYAYVHDAVDTMIGVMYNKPPVIELPAAMELMRENIDGRGDSITNLLRRINVQQLVTGRVGLMLDIATPVNEPPLFYMSTYNAEDILNWSLNDRISSVWRPSLDMVTLEEKTYLHGPDFSWNQIKRHRILEMQDGKYIQRVYHDQKLISEVAPVYRGTPIPEIPFVLINSKDISAAPDDPPLIGLARLALSIYRGEADYRQNLFMQGQDTLVLIGNLRAEDAQMPRIGAGALLKLPEGADAKYIGVNSNGLPEQRQALEADKDLAVSRSGRIVQPGQRQKESGEALHIRVAAETATLNQIALTAAAGVENLLRLAAEWMGQDPEQVRVIPNLDFIQEKFSGSELVELMTAKNMGAPLSSETLHEIMSERGVTTRTYEEEQELMDTEDPPRLRTRPGMFDNEDSQ